MSRKLQNIVVFGATSAIAQAVCRNLSERKSGPKPRFFLVARDVTKLEAVAADLKVRGADLVDVHTADLADTAAHADLVAKAWQRLGSVDAAILAHGILGDQKEGERDWEHAENILHINFTSVASLITHLANRFEMQGSGELVAIGSVAGDRGRKTNYVYGSAKGALEIFLQGVRHRLAPKGIAVVTVKPGFVETPMTAHLPRSPLFASPDKVAQTIVSAMDAGKSMVYAPFFWQPIMMVIRSLPETIFNRLNF